MRIDHRVAERFSAFSPAKLFVAANTLGVLRKEAKNDWWHTENALKRSATGRPILPVETD